MKKLFVILLTIFALGTFAQAPVMNSINGPTAVCSSPSSPLSFSTSASNSPTSYSWSVIPSSSVSITNASSSVTSISFPYSNGTYTIYCYATNGSGSSPTQSFVVTVFETPSITFSGANTFCQGSSTNLSASSTILAASPTIFYNWSPPSGLNTSVGPNVIASPIITTTYVVTATKGMCSNTAAIVVTPLNNPNVNANISYTTICAGSQVTLFGIGAITYTWTNNIFNNIPFSPTITNGYIVTGTDANGCTDTAFAQVTVQQYPTFAVVSSASVFCIGQDPANITITGTGSSYSLNGNPTPPSFTISPTATTNYTITSSTSAGCSTTQLFTQMVSNCIGLTENTGIEHTLNAYPNPNNGSFNLKSGIAQQILVFNSLGQVVRTLQLSTGENKISGLSPGIYIIEARTQRIKIVVND
jgi:hypothetical protein